MGVEIVFWFGWGAWIFKQVHKNLQKVKPVLAILEEGSKINSEKGMKVELSG